MISVLAPSRGRPDAFQEMADTAYQTAEGDIEVLGYVDDDDPSDYPDNTIRGPRIVLSDMWNRLAEHARGDVLMMGADDIRYRTPGWDTRFAEVFEAFPDRIVFVHGRDGIHDHKLGTHGAVSRRWVETVGYFTPPWFPCDFADTWIHDLADRIGRRVYLPEVMVEHLHPIVHKAEWDATHKERMARGHAVNVGQLWRDLEPRRVDDAEKLEAACF